jgi:hypothetical protein
LKNKINLTLIKFNTKSTKKLNNISSQWQFVLSFFCCVTLKIVVLCFVFGLQFWFLGVDLLVTLTSSTYDFYQLVWFGLILLLMLGVLVYFKVPFLFVSLVLYIVSFNYYLPWRLKFSFFLVLRLEALITLCWSCISQGINKYWNAYELCL